MKRKLLFPILALLLALSACGDNFFSYYSDGAIKRLARKGGEWNIDEMEIWVIARNDYEIYDRVTRKDVGTMTFRDDETGDITFKNDTIDLKYITFHSTKDQEWGYTGGLMQVPLGDAHGYATQLDKNDMLIVCPYTLNTFLAEREYIGASVELKFKLSRK